MLRKVAAALIEAGLRFDDPTRELRRMRLAPSGVDKLPSREDVERVIASIEAQGKARSKEAANFVRFLLLTGCRIGEAQAVQWEDIGTDWLFVRDGKSGPRRIPVSRPLRALVESMRPTDDVGPVLHLKSPREALRGACIREGVPHLRVHDLRHLFATHAIESGVDVPTVARWLGHKDGGALAMKTYGHIRDDHSLQAVRRLG